GFEDILEFIYRNKTVINNIYMVVDRSSIRQFLNELIYRHAAIVINKEIAGQEYSNKALDVITDFYKNAFFEAIITWIDEGMKQKPKELATLYSNVFKGTVEAALKSAELTYK
ncbi:MAG: TetR-like C-terminal domain-containing protein, partial [Bacillota bacterium]|nr:TetR-like C-terminal domain-containing protein [Bacillota bacterium]